MSDAPAPENMLKQVHCKCRKSECKTKACSCVSAGLFCTELCGCAKCQNYIPDPSAEDAMDSDSDDDDKFYE